MARVPAATLHRGVAGAMLAVDGLCYAAGPRQLFDGWSCRVAPGITLLQGAEGSGKTSLLRLFAAELHAQSGQFRIGDIDLATQAGAYRAQVYLADLRTDVFDQLSPRACLAALQQRYPHFDPSVVDGLMHGLSLTEHQHKPLYMLSTGSRRKVWFAAAVASGAVLTLLDDPFAALDRRSIGFVCEVLRNVARQPQRIWLLADYQAPPDVPLAGVIDLD